MSALVECACVDPKHAHMYWGAAAALIRKAMERGRMGDYAEVEHDVRNGASLLWFAYEGTDILAAAVTQLNMIEGERACTIVALGGENFAKYGHLRGRLEDYARAENCLRMRVIGREGWIRVLPDYRVRAVILEKAL
jgi:hypothetical protein